jgi:hypothetical protein
LGSTIAVRGATGRPLISDDADMVIVAFLVGRTIGVAGTSCVGARDIIIIARRATGLGRIVGIDIGAHMANALNRQTAAGGALLWDSCGNTAATVVGRIILTRLAFGKLAAL